jgi:small-conductance mechanosensitive channel
MITDPTPEAATDEGATPADGVELVTPASTPTPADTGEPSSMVGAADGLKDVVIADDGGNSTFGEIVLALDSYGIEIGGSYFSLLSALMVVLVIVGVYLVARLLSKFSHYLLGKMTRLDDTQRLLSEKLLTVAVWTISVLIGIDMLGIDLTALTVFSGAFGLAVGFGLQKTFGNLIAGIILLMDRSIKPGDVISVTDAAGNEGFGQIRKIGIRAISVITRDRTEYLIPNENLMINQVVNWSYSSRDVRVKAPVGVAYGSDLDLVSDLLMKAAVDTPRVLKAPKPRVNLMGFGDSSIDFEIRFWIQDPEEGLANIRSDVYRKIWQLFQENEIEIPFPQRDLNIRGNDQLDQLVAAIAQRVEKRARTPAKADLPPDKSILAFRLRPASPCGRHGKWPENRHRPPRGRRTGRSRPVDAACRAAAHQRQTGGS